MSRQAHLPPRGHFQKKPNVHPVSPSLRENIALHYWHHKSVSQSYGKEQPPAWLDDLLDESESNSSSILHRCSASDSVTLLDDLPSLTSLDNLYIRDTSASRENDGSLMLASIYGPNSPRGKGELMFPENGIVSALSEYVRHKHWQNLDDSFCASKVAAYKVPENAWGSTGEVMPETKPVKRHPGQRSRIRKLQYIAELERTVCMLQGMESDLAARVAFLLQQRLSLVVENNKLKQKLVRLEQRKLIVEGQNHTLRKESEMLKVNMGFSSKSSLKVTSRLTSAEKTWQMFDMGKLNLNSKCL